MKLDRNTFKRVLQESMSDVFNDYIDPSENIDGIEAEQEEEENPLNDPINNSFTNHKLGEMAESVSKSIIAELSGEKYADTANKANTIGNKTKSIFKPHKRGQASRIRDLAQKKAQRIMDNNPSKAKDDGKSYANAFSLGDSKKIQTSADYYRATSSSYDGTRMDSANNDREAAKKFVDGYNNKIKESRLRKFIDNTVKQTILENKKRGI